MIGGRAGVVYQGMGSGSGSAMLMVGGNGGGDFEVAIVERGLVVGIVDVVGILNATASVNLLGTFW